MRGEVGWGSEGPGAVRRQGAGVCGKGRDPGEAIREQQGLDGAGVLGGQIEGWGPGHDSPPLTGPPYNV